MMCLRYWRKTGNIDPLGATDIIPDIKNGKYSFSKIMDLSRVKELKGINKTGDTIRIGSCVTNGDPIRAA